MSRLHFTLFLLAALAFGLWLGTEPDEKPPEALKRISKPSQPPTKISTDPVEIFQRAFWRRPGEKDRILHAERREWSNNDGVQRWAWFIVIEPGAELLAYLREKNPFQLQSAAAPQIENAPEWFTPPAKAEIRSRDAFHLFCSRDGRTLHASASGKGFAPPVGR